MTIDGIDLSSFGAVLLSKQISSHDIVQVYDWLDGAMSPVFSRTEQRFKEILLTILLESESEAETEALFTALIGAVKACTVAFFGEPKRYDCHFEGKAEPKRLTARAWLVELELLCHRTFLPEVVTIASGVSLKTITNTGALPAPCRILVTPSVAMPEFVIQGFSSEIRLQNLSANQPHLVDGYLYRYLKEGSNDIANYQSFSWPVLPVGTIELVFSEVTAEITIQYFPLFI